MSKRAFTWIERGFTLIELLIVVAIIAILAAIAVPNFLEAQVRSKVARVRADMRSIATALEIYCVDNNIYPCRPTCEADCGCWRGALTTPIAYISAGFEDPFASRDSPENRYYRYSICYKMKSWIFVSLGPDRKSAFDPTLWMCGMAPALACSSSRECCMSASKAAAVSPGGALPIPNGWETSSEFHALARKRAGLAASADCLPFRKITSTSLASPANNVK